MAGVAEDVNFPVKNVYLDFSYAHSRCLCPTMTLRDNGLQGM